MLRSPPLRYSVVCCHLCDIIMFDKSIKCIVFQGAAVFLYVVFAVFHCSVWLFMSTGFSHVTVEWESTRRYSVAFSCLARSKSPAG